MKLLLVGIMSLAGATSAEATEAWTCTYTLGFTNEPQLKRFEISPPDLIDTGTNEHYRILQNNDYGIVATDTISEIQSGLKAPSVGAFTVVINKDTSEFWQAIMATGREANLVTQWHGKCLKD
jgi:hypothetical protein